MNKYFRDLVIVFFMIVLAKIIISWFVKSPTVFSDEYFYSKMALSFFEGDFWSRVHGLFSTQYPPFYPLVISLSYVFSNMEIVYFLIKVINAFVSSFVVFAAWLICREFFNDKKSFFVSLLIGLFPSMFMFSPYVLSENLFYPLFLFSVYFIYKAFKENYWALLAGLFVGLAFMTKVHGIVLILGFVFYFLFYWIRYRKFKWRIGLLFFVIIILVSLPWLLRNGMIFGFSVTGLLGGWEREIVFSEGNKYYTLFIWFFLYLMYAFVASLFVFFLSVVKNFKKLLKKDFFVLTLILGFFTILFAANHNTSVPWMLDNFLMIKGRLIGRYIDFFIPLILIFGFFGVKNLKLKEFVLGALLLVPSVLLLGYTLFPVNNMSLIWLGGLNYFGLGVIGLVVGYVVLFLMSKKVKVFPLIFVLLIVLNVGFVVYNSSNWYNDDQMQIGLGLNGVVLLDERDEGRIVDNEGVYEALKHGTFSTKLGFWLKDVRIGSVDDLNGVDYVVTMHDLDLELVERKGEFRVYSV